MLWMILHIANLGCRHFEVSMSRKSTVFERLKLFSRVERVGKIRWASRGTYILVGIAAATGVNLWWRFPSAALKFGGGTFLLAYLTAVLTTGIPLIILESSLGQRSQRAIARTFKAINKRWEWLGWFSTLVSALVALYLMVMLGWTLVMIGQSFNSLFQVAEELPWAKKRRRFHRPELLRKLGGGELALPGARDHLFPGVLLDHSPDDRCQGATRSGAFHKDDLLDRAAVLDHMLIPLPGLRGIRHQGRGTRAVVGRSA